MKTIEIKRAIVELHKKKFTVAQIVQSLNNEVATKTVYNVINRFNESGDVKRKPRPGKRKFSSTMKTIMQDIYTEDR